MEIRDSRDLKVENRRCITKQKKRGEESVCEEQESRVERKEEQTIPRIPSTSLAKRERQEERRGEERRGEVAVKDGERPQNTKERINAGRLFKSFLR